MKKFAFCSAIFLAGFFIAFSVFGLIIWFRTHSFPHLILAVILGVILGTAGVVSFLAKIRE
jgi:hypothetical protein